MGCNELNVIGKLFMEIVWMCMDIELNLYIWMESVHYIEFVKWLNEIM